MVRHGQSLPLSVASPNAITTPSKGMAMRPLTLPDLVALAAGQALALVTACASTYEIGRAHV